MGQSSNGLHHTLPNELDRSYSKLGRGLAPIIGMNWRACLGARLHLAYMMKTFILLIAFACIEAVGQDATSPTYGERYRPQYHFSPRQNWTNDPNGLVYFEGEYHLFFQYNPFSDQWDHMSWGHAV